MEGAVQVSSRESSPPSMDLPRLSMVPLQLALSCNAGCLKVDFPDGTSKSFGITRAHMEEDSGDFVAPLRYHL